jgi:hypothetical protein
VVVTEQYTSNNDNRRRDRINGQLDFIKKGIFDILKLLLIYLNIDTYSHTYVQKLSRLLCVYIVIFLCIALIEWDT